jgi:hypothetical protein
MATRPRLKRRRPKRGPADEPGQGCDAYLPVTVSEPAAITTLFVEGPHADYGINRKWSANLLEAAKVAADISSTEDAYPFAGPSVS